MVITINRNGCWYNISSYNNLLMSQKLIDLSEPQKALLDSIKTRNLFLAGVGSGKSHAAAIVSARFVKNFPRVRGFIGANTYSQLTKSTLLRVFDVWKNQFGWTRGVDYVVDIQPPHHFVIIGAKLKKYDNVISFANGHLIFTASLENYKAIDGTEFGYALLDETKDTKEEAVKEVIVARLRQIGIYNVDGYIVDRKDMKILCVYNLEKDSWFSKNTKEKARGFNPLYVFTSPAKVEWLNEWFLIDSHLEEINQKIFSKKDFYYSEHSEKISVTICSTYHNEKNLSEGYIDNLLSDYSHNKSLVDMLIYGSPVAKTGGEWFSRFDRIKHIKKLEYDNKYPIHVSLDFNVVPYMTLLVSQFIPDEKTGVIKWKTLKEYCLKNPNNNTDSICTEFLYDYAGNINGLFYTGDPSGKNRTTLTRAIDHNYTVLEQILVSYLSNSSDRVMNVAPSLVKCRDFFNKMFAGGYNVEIEIDESCTNLITDFEFLKEDINGAYKKPKVKDSSTGETYEKLGHCADAWRYQGVSAFQDLFESS